MIISAMMIANHCQKRSAVITPIFVGPGFPAWPHEKLSLRGGNHMNAHYACNSPAHAFSRRQFLAGTAAGAVGMLGFKDMLSPANATELRRQDKRVLVIFLAGGVSQLETWDPKPGTVTGGPFQAIPTSVSGT